LTETFVGTDIKKTFAIFYEEYMPKVFRYIHFRLNDEEISEDLTSEVFEKALVNFKKYSKKKASFSTWIFTITKNTVIDYYRTSNKKQFTPLDESYESPSRKLLPNEELEKKEERELLNNSLKQLSEEEQELIRLKFSARLNNRQIASMTGMSESNVGVKLYRTLKKLRGNLQGSLNG
jgi:RNA polymerase sigma factor (sigma-70 family)